MLPPFSLKAGYDVFKERTDGLTLLIPKTILITQGSHKFEEKKVNKKALKKIYILWRRSHV